MIIVKKTQLPIFNYVNMLITLIFKLDSYDSKDRPNDYLLNKFENNEMNNQKPFNSFYISQNKICIPHNPKKKI